MASRRRARWDISTTSRSRPCTPRGNERGTWTGSRRVMYRYGTVAGERVRGWVGRFAVRRRIAGTWVSIIVAACATSAAHAGSLPSVTSGQRPGPDLLYAAPPRAPQLENAGI